MGFYFQNDYWEGAKYLPENQRKTFVFAVVNYYFTGEEIDLKDQAKGQFIQVKRRIDMARQEAEKKQKQRDKSGDKPRDKRGTLLNKEGEGEGEVSTNVDTNPLLSPFAIQCLNALNEVLGTTYASMPDKCGRTLQRFEGKYDLDAVKAMLRYKREEWQGTKYRSCLTPNTLFSPDHFEQYIHQAMTEQKEADTYAVYDR